MPWLCNMGGFPIEFPPAVCVVRISQSNMRSLAHGEASPPFDITKSGNVTANLLTEVCNHVRVEPNLQEVTNEELSGGSANTTKGARLDIATSGFWGGRFERTFLNVRVFNPCSCHFQFGVHFRFYRNIDGRGTPPQS